MKVEFSHSIPAPIAAQPARASRARIHLQQCRDGRWRACVALDGHSSVRTGFASRQDARTWARAQLSAPTPAQPAVPRCLTMAQALGLDLRSEPRPQPRRRTFWGS